MFRLRYSRKDCCSKSRQTFHRMISQSYLQTKQNDETVAKKKFFHLPIFFLLIAKSVVAKNEEEKCADSFKTNGFPQSLSPPLCQMKLQ